MTPAELADLLFDETRAMLDADREALLTKVGGILDVRLAAIPAGKDGLDGKDGTPGPQGDRGDPGEPGAPGDRGEKGDPGEPGPAGRDGLDGKDGPPGEMGGPGPIGEKGLDGRDGRDGKDGRDGIATRDELETLVRDAVAKAVPEIVEKLIDAAVARVPRMEYREVWSPEESYRKGDVVTFGGSMWACLKDAPDSKPGTPGGAKDWRLAVKKGRDGKGT